MTAELVIVDLDDTLWKWCQTWHSGFVAFNESLTSHGFSPAESAEAWAVMYDRLLGATIEFPPTVDDLRESLSPNLSDEELEAFRFEAAVASAASRDKNLALFPGVRETLETLRYEGVRVVAHTDSPVSAAEARLRRTGLNGLVAELHARPLFGDFGPAGSPEGTVVVRTQGWEGKPSTKVLGRILAEHGVDPSKTFYVGDSKRRDIPMARAAGCVGVWARYGLEYPERDVAIEALLVAQRRRTFPPDHSFQADTRDEMRPAHTVDSFPEILILVL